MHDQASAPRSSNPPKPQTTPNNSLVDPSVPCGDPTANLRKPKAVNAASSRQPASCSAGGGISRAASEPIQAEVRSPRSEVEEQKVAPWAPDSRFPKAQNEVISFVRNILLTNPLFPKFYADVILRYLPKSREARILRPWYQKILEKVNWKDSSMANTKTCTHIKVTGVRCGSPALYGEGFCYFHQRMHRGVRMPAQARLHPIALIEDEESIQAALMEVINALMRNTIDLKRATLILRALHIAVKNAHRVKFGLEKTNMVREVPNYPEPERPPEPRHYTPEEIEVVKAQIWAEHKKEQAAKAAEAAQAAAAKAAPAAGVQAPPPALPASTTKNVETAAASVQATPTLSDAKGTGSATPPNAPIPPAHEIAAHDFKPQCVQPTTQPIQKNAATASERKLAPLPPRKPAATAQAPKERKNAARRASAG